MVASRESQPHGGRAFMRHTRPDPRRYGTPRRRCPNILYQGNRCAHPGRERSRLFGRQVELRAVTVLARLIPRGESRE